MERKHNKFKPLLLVIGLLFFAHFVQAQVVENATIQRVDDDLIVVFDLIPKVSVKELYQITVTANYANQSREMKAKEGSLSDVRPGNRLQFLFSGSENFDNFKGEVDFSISARMTYSPIRFVNPDEGKNVRRGKPLNIAWRGGLEQDQYALSLQNGDSSINIIDAQISQESYQWKIPKKTKLGGNYQLKLTSNLNPNQAALSTEFSIKRKIPLVIKIAPAVLLGGAAYYFIKESDSGSTSEGEGFPDPPDLPTQ